MNKSESKSRRYVAMCSRGRFDGYYFKSFTLPQFDRTGEALENNSQVAAWYFLNRLDFVACIEGCVTEEDFKAVQEAEPMWAARPEVVS